MTDVTKVTKVTEVTLRMRAPSGCRIGRMVEPSPRRVKTQGRRRLLAGREMAEAPEGLSLARAVRDHEICAALTEAVAHGTRRTEVRRAGSSARHLRVAAAPLRVSHFFAGPSEGCPKYRNRHCSSSGPNRVFPPGRQFQADPLPLENEPADTRRARSDLP